MATAVIATSAGVTKKRMKGDRGAPFLFPKEEEREMGDAARRRNVEVQIIEARRAPRASAYVCVDVFSDQDFWTGVSLNLSEGGVFVATHHMVPIGSTVVLHMLLPFEQEAIVTLGDVRWTREQADDETGAVPGLGIEFVGLSADALSRIRRFVDAVTQPLVIE